MTWPCPERGRAGGRVKTKKIEVFKKSKPVLIETSPRDTPSKQEAPTGLSVGLSEESGTFLLIRGKK